MAVAGVTLDLPQTFPVVTLVEVGGSGRLLRFPVGLAEGSALAYALEGISTPRPLTHDVVAEIFGHFGIDVELVRITGLEGRTLLAEMVVSAGPKRHTVACRPSDGLAFALRAPVAVPIMVAEEVLAVAGEPPEDPSDAASSEAQSPEAQSPEAQSPEAQSAEVESSGAAPPGDSPPDGGPSSGGDREASDDASPSGPAPEHGESTGDLPTVGPLPAGRGVGEDGTARGGTPDATPAAPAGAPAGDGRAAGPPADRSASS